MNCRIAVVLTLCLSGRVWLKKCVPSYIRDRADSHGIVTLGDMDAHIEHLDGYTDTTGNMSLNLCEERDFVLVNTEDKCLGKISLEALRCQS